MCWRVYRPRRPVRSVNYCHTTGWCQVRRCDYQTLTTGNHWQRWCANQQPLRESIEGGRYDRRGAKTLSEVSIQLQFQVVVATQEVQWVIPVGFEERARFQRDGP